MSQNKIAKKKHHQGHHNQKSKQKIDGKQGIQIMHYKIRTDFCVQHFYATIAKLL